jgi:hypothetical protein
MKPEIQFESIFPPVFLAVVMIAAAVLVIRSYHREGVGRYSRRIQRSLIALRLLVIAAILFILAKPVLHRLTEIREPATVMLLVDASESMATKDVIGEWQRFEKAKALAYEYSQALSGRFRVRPYFFSTFLAPVESDDIVSQEIHASGATNLTGSMEEALIGEAGQAMAGMVVLTDGAHNTGPAIGEIIPRLNERSVPVYAVGIGEKTGYVDLEVREFSGPPFAYAGETLELKVRVANYGVPDPSGKLVVRIEAHTPPEEERKPDPRVGESIAAENLDIPPAGSERNYRLEFQVREEGVYRLVAEVPTAVGETMPENNRKELLIETTKRRLRVLYIEGTPRWEYKFIQQALRGDQRFLSSGLIRYQTGSFWFQGVEIDPANPWGGKIHRAPLDPNWEGIDAVILGDLSAVSFTESSLQRLNRAIEEGKINLVLIPGPVSVVDDGFSRSPLAKWIPFHGMSKRIEAPIIVRPDSTQPDSRILYPPRSASGGEMVWPELAPSPGYYSFESVAPGAGILAKGTAQGRETAVIALQRSPGGGKVLGLAIDDTWRWRIAGSGGDVVNDFPLSFWRQVMRWLITGRIDDPDVGIYLTVDKSHYIRGDNVSLGIRGTLPSGVSLEDAKIDVEYIQPDGVSQPLEIRPPVLPGTEDQSFSFVRTLTPRRPGGYAVRAVLSAGDEVIDRAEAAFTVSDTALEKARAGLDEDLLRRLADETGGRYYPAAVAEDLPRDIPDKVNIDVRPEETPLWDNPLLFLAIVSLLAAEWAVRKRRDMA